MTTPNIDPKPMDPRLSVARPPAEGTCARCGLHVTLKRIGHNGAFSSFAPNAPIFRWRADDGWSTYCLHRPDGWREEYVDHPPATEETDETTAP